MTEIRNQQERHVPREEVNLTEVLPHLVSPTPNQAGLSNLGL